MFGIVRKDDLISMKHLNELLHKLNKKEEIKERKLNTWLIIGLVAAVLVVTGAIVYKLFFSVKEDYDDYDEFDDDFDDMDYDDDYDEFEDEDDFDEDFEDEDFEDEEDFEDDAVEDELEESNEKSE